MSMTEQIYAAGTLLRHHAGSTWKVMAYVEGDYTILCTVGTVRPGRIGGEVDGAVRDGIHADYLHGDGWSRVEETA
jgi:hypothetical protein